MSTSATLPAGYFITSINGKRCTAVPRTLTTIPGSAATSTSVGAASVTTNTLSSSSTSIITEAIAPSAQVQGAAFNSGDSVTSTGAATSTTSIPQTIPIISSNSQASPIATSGSAVALSISTSEASPNPSTTEVPSNPSIAVPVSTGTAETSASATSAPIAESEISYPSVTTSNDPNDFPTGTGPTSFPPPTAASNPTHPTQVSASAGISSNLRVAPGPVVGGVVGGIALIGIIAFLFWYLRRRRRDQRDSLLTPLDAGRGTSSSEVGNGSVGLTKLGIRVGAQFKHQIGRVRGAAVWLGASLKSVVVGARSDIPSVNLDRGNSQFFDGPIPQHSRNQSLLSNNCGQRTTNDRLNDLWERLREKISFSWLLRRQKREPPVDPFATARGLTEKQANISGTPDFSKLLNMDDRGVQFPSERRSASLPAGNDLGSSVPNVGSLEVNFETNNPFADPVLAAPPAAQDKPWASPATDVGPNIVNPFADPITQPQPSIQKTNTYMANTRRSRGQSIDTANNHSTTYSQLRSSGLSSRYSSGIALSRDSRLRDTLSSSFSVNARSGKGRSDPFDLERPELRYPTNQNTIGTSNRALSRDGTFLYPDPLRMSSPHASCVATGGHTDSQGTQPRITSNEPFASKYPSGVSSVGTASRLSFGSSIVSSLAGWGDPGPDLGSRREGRGYDW